MDPKCPSKGQGLGPTSLCVLPRAVGAKARYRAGDSGVSCPLPMPGSGVALAPAHLLSRGENLQVLDGEVEPDWGGLSQDEPHCRHLVHVTQHL